MAYRATLNVHDASGTGQISTSWWQLDTGVDLANSVLGCSDAFPVSFLATQLLSGVSGGGAGGIPVTTAARLWFATAAGGKLSLLVPSVDASVFLADNETVNPSSTLVSLLSAQMISEGCDAIGNAVTAYISGTRVTLRLPGIQF
jgi:hypothetical protein